MKEKEVVQLHGKVFLYYSSKGKEATFDYQAHISEKPVNSE